MLLLAIITTVGPLVPAQHREFLYPDHFLTAFGALCRRGWQRWFAMVFELEPKGPFHLEVLSTLKSGHCSIFKSIVGTCSTAQHARGLGLAAGPFFTCPGDELIGPHQNE